MLLCELVGELTEIHAHSDPKTPNPNLDLKPTPHSPASTKHIVNLNLSK